MRLDLALVLSLTLAGIAQAAEDAVPIEQEPRHRLAFENRHVRHFDVELEPGYVALYHWHRNDGVFVNITPSDTIAQDLNGEPKQRGWRAMGETYFIGYAEKPKAHRVTNSGNRSYRVTDTEILQSCGAAPSGFSPAGNQTIIVDNQRVFVTRIILHPGESTELGGPCGMLVSIYDSDVRLEGPGGNKDLSLSRADFHWREANQTYKLRNTGKIVFHGVDIRIK